MKSLHSSTLFSLFFLKLKVKSTKYFKSLTLQFLNWKFPKNTPSPSFSTFTRSHKFSQMLFVPYLLNRCFSVLALLHLKIFLYNSKIESVLNTVFSLFPQTETKKRGIVLAPLYLKIFLYNSNIESVLNAVFSLFLRLGLKSMAPPQQQQPPPDRHPINSSNNTTGRRSVKNIDKMIA